jgi:hypothetical protein
MEGPNIPPLHPNMSKSKDDSKKLFTSVAVYGKGITDNGPKWGSYTKRDANGSFNYDERLHKENPQKWQAMIDERMAWIHKKPDAQTNRTGTPNK